MTSFIILKTSLVVIFFTLCSLVQVQGIALQHCKNVCQPDGIGGCVTTGYGTEIPIISAISQQKDNLLTLIDADSESTFYSSEEENANVKVTFGEVRMGRRFGTITDMQILNKEHQAAFILVTYSQHDDWPSKTYVYQTSNLFFHKCYSYAADGSYNVNHVEKVVAYRAK